MEPILYTMKRYFFLAQAEKYFAEFNIKSELEGESLRIDVPMCSRAMLTCNDFGWRLIFLPAASIGSFSPDPVTILTGGYTIRCTLVVAHLVFWYQLWRSSHLHLSHLVQLSPVGSAVTGDRSLSIFLRIDGHFLSVSLCSMFKVIYCTSHVHRCVVSSSVSPQFQISAPSTGILRQFIPSYPTSEQFLAFMQLIVMPIIRIPDQWKNLNSRWSVFPYSKIHPPISFALVYKRRYSLFLIVKLMTCLTLIPKIGLSAYLPFGLREFRLVSLPRHDYHIYQVKFPSVRYIIERIEELGDVFNVLLDAGFSPDISTFAFQRQIDKYLFRIVFSESKLRYDLQGCDLASEQLNLLADGTIPSCSFMSSVIRLVQCFLPRDDRVLITTLRLLVRIRSTLELVVICQAMQSVAVGDDGRPSIQIPCGEGFTVRFPVPYGPAAQLEISSGSRSEKVRGIDGIITRLNDKAGLFHACL
jgi:hypothetical protein